MSGYSALALLFFLVAVVAQENLNHIRCGTAVGAECGYGDCTGRACPDMYPGHKSQWPELQGVVSAIKAKEIIERDNPFVKASIYPYGTKYPAVICSKRVILETPKNDCPNGLVVNSPFVG